MSSLIKEYFTNKPDGLPGNDDTGTMSAWLIYSMMGIYPSSPADPIYTITSPVFDKISIKLNKDYYPGEMFEIQTVNNSPENVYVNKMQFNGKSLKVNAIKQSDIIKGGVLLLNMEPNSVKN